LPYAQAKDKYHSDMLVICNSDVFLKTGLKGKTRIPYLLYKDTPASTKIVGDFGSF